ncbi:MAG: efflux RND transporter permease subunit, partial [Kiritimatiellae bacterium]|nr:efflux RND transporter permease subunit [Kiritimatiellia bacterium]
MSIDIKNSGPIAWMIKNPVAANLLMLICLIGGVVMFSGITQEFLPDVSPPVVTVDVAYPGASPEEVEQGIVLAIEEGLRGLDGIDEIRSVASEGGASISVELLDGVAIDKIYNDIKSEVDRVTTFPENAEEPQVAMASIKRSVVTAVIYGDVREKSLREQAEQFRDLLLQHPKLTQVDLYGIRPLEISIEISQENLRRYNLTIKEVARILAVKSLELPGGGIKTYGGEILLRVADRRDYGREFASIPIINTADGSQVLLSDIAVVTDGFKDTDNYATYNGKRAVKLEIYRIGKQTPSEVADAVDTVVKNITVDMPAGISIEVVNSRADMFKDRASLLLRNGAMGLVLVMVLLGFFLEIRLAFWVMMGIPVSFLGALLIMPAADLTINMVTMFAFIVALGIVVDDAIVVGENIYHHKQDGMDPLKAAIAGAQEVATPVGFSILTNVVTFIPLMMMPGVMGRIMKMLPVVVIATFLLSWIESLLILPSHLSHQSKDIRRGPYKWIHDRQQSFSNKFRNWVRTKYGPFLEVCLTHRYFVVAVAIAILAVTLGYFASGRMGFTMFPTVESDFAMGSAVLPYGVPVEKTDAVAKRMLKAAQDVAEECGHPELIDGIFTEIGSGGSHIVKMQVFMVDSKIRDKIMGTEEFVNLWRKKIGMVPGVKGIRLQADFGGPGSGPALTIELSHRDVATLEMAAPDLAATLTEFPRIKDIDDGYQQGKQQLSFRVKPEGESLGLTARDVAEQVRFAYEGAEAIRQQRGRNELRVQIRLPEEERVSEYNLDNMIIQTPAGLEVPLMEVAEVDRGHAYTTINRRNGKRTITVIADVVPKPQAKQVMGGLNVEAMPDLVEKYPGLSYSYEGRSAENRESMNSMKKTMPLILLAIYALLAVPFKSYVQPLIVMISIPFGIVGAILGHLIMGYSMSMIGLIGVIALSGVVVNDALVMITFINNARKHHASAHDAVINAGIQRFRPIMLTTLTTFGGLSPMIFETSRQARFLIPMAISLGYGLLFATLITLILV